MASGTPTSESAFPLAERPRLRPVDAYPTRHLGQAGLVLRDTSDRDLAPLFVSQEAVRILQLLDGRRTLDAIARTAASRAVPVSEADVRQLLTQLDAAGYLEGPRAQHRLQQRRAAFLALETRPAIFAGGAYPDLPELSRFLDRAYIAKNGPGAVPLSISRAPDAQPVRAIIAPHVDLHRGAPTYAWAYKALAEAAPADLYVVLGTCHTKVVGHFAATRKPYDTPFGPVPTDTAFLGALQRAYGHDLFAGEFSHAGEHAIEFQAVYLRSLGLAGEGSAPMVAILCDSLHGIVPRGWSPRDAPLVTTFVDALQRTASADGRRITIIAAVDLAHVGVRFGDDWRVTPDQAKRVEQADREMMQLVLAADSEGYYRHVMRDDDARRICGLTPMYVLTALMEAEDRHGDLLRYTQWIDDDLSSSVTFVSAQFR
ncbi:MAG: AmmeMemoRadiSam system protein B [Chloroflexota bacterium]